MGAAQPMTLRASPLAVRLALADLWHDRRITLCLIAALAAVITPLLLLIGLKTGVIETMRERLLKNPRNLEIRILGNGALDRAWFQRLGARPEVAFLVPQTRSLNTQVDLVVDAQRFLRNVEVIPSGPGDPLLAPYGLPVPHATDEVVLSHATAQTLGLVTGSRVSVVVPRRLHGQDEVGRMQVRVLGILPEAATERTALLATVGFLETIEDFRDGAPSPQLGVPDGDKLPPRTVFARARLYVHRLEQVAVIADLLRSTGLEVDTRANEIETVLALNRVFNTVIRVIGGLAGLAAGAALVGSFLANIDRKRTDLALLRLVGFPRRGLVFFPAAQAVAIGGLAFVLSLAGYGVGVLFFDRLLGSQLASGEYVCRLEAPAVITVGLLTLLLAVLAATLGAQRAVHIDPAESLRAA
jgi:putative ABC transport system permease protein